MSIITELFRSPLIWVGFIVRLLLLWLFDPLSVTDWFAPFLQTSFDKISVDPWGTWMTSGGDPKAFPYGYAMWIVFFPAMMFAGLFNISAEFAYFGTILLADFCLLLILLKLLPKRSNFILKAYWLSPVIVFASYSLGLNDIIPAVILMTAVLFLKENRIFRSAAFLGLSISAKLSMLVAPPFFLVYLFNNRSLRHYVWSLIITLICFGLVFGVPFLASSDAVLMLFGNPEMSKAFYLVLPLGNDTDVYVLPLIYLSLLYVGWRIRPLNFDLFAILIGISFLMIVILTPGSPGWLIWSIPFLVLYQSRGDTTAIGLITIFSFIYLLQMALTEDLVLRHHILDNIYQNFKFEFQYETIFLKLLQTAISFTAVLIGYRMWREEILRSDYFKFNRKPMTIGISGDSGSGKDTLVKALEGLMGSHSVVKLSGDDYHRWDRHRPMWRVMTHINPLANDLQTFSTDLFRLKNGNAIYQRHYDHESGKMSKPVKVKSNQYILVSGLHTFSIPLVKNACDLKVFLDIDDDLRRFFKIRRDMSERGHSKEKVLESLERRSADSERFIRPQAHSADIIMSLKTLKDCIIDSDPHIEIPKLKLSATIKNSYNELSLQRILVGICGLHVDMDSNADGSEITLTIEGECSSEDMAQAAILLSCATFEFLDENPVWEDGMIGVMQIIVFSQISQLITRSVSE